MHNQESCEHDKLHKIRVLVEVIFSEMFLVGAFVHPYVFDEFAEIAKILEIDSSKIPTERRIMCDD